MCTGFAEAGLAAADVTAGWMCRIDREFHEVKLFLRLASMSPLTAAAVALPPLPLRAVSGDIETTCWQRPRPAGGKRVTQSAQPSAGAGETTVLASTLLLHDCRAAAVTARQMKRRYSPPPSCSTPRRRATL